YQAILINEFHDRFTPCSFTPTTARMSNAAKNWLTQNAVSRQVVLLLGFGLGMTVNDVNDFLTKACQEPMLDPKDPQEALCYYCYRFGYGYLKYQSLWEQYEALTPEKAVPVPDEDNQTILLRKYLGDIVTDTQMLEYLGRLKTENGKSRQGASAFRTFERLYGRVQECVADWLNESEAENARLQRARLADALPRSDRLFDYEKNALLEKAEAFRHCTKEEITPADIENVLLAAVPKGNSGNLMPMKESALNQQFRGRRLSRQRLSELLAGKTPVSRYDLMTLRFLICTRTLAEEPSPRRRCAAFFEKTNRMLIRCNMRPMYVANPYEWFLLMCTVTDDPLGTYADVWELSYEKEA
ncbi:MAG: hypothetical protein IJ174_04065, partial [Clostridia bacterium]|nr:hypothetical protein [Clostridia bacterium]